MKTIRALRGTTVALLVVAGALPAVQAQGIPSVEACKSYAAAEAAAEAAAQQVNAAFFAAIQQAEATLEAAYQQADYYAEQRAHVTYDVTIELALAAYKAAMQQTLPTAKAADQQAKQALNTAYFASYDIDGGARSDVPDVMDKLLEHHRQRCRELHGL